MSHPASALADRLIDFQLLPAEVHPTGLKSDIKTCSGMLAQGDDILWVFYLDHVDQELKKGHRRVISTLLRFNHLDAPGSIQVVVLWGHEGTICRAIEVFGPLAEARRETTTSEVQRWFSDWFDARRKVR